MDQQTFINILIGVIFAIIGWYVRVMWDAQKELSRDLRDLELGLPERFARKDDMEKLADALFRKLDSMAETQVQILRALDGKQDRK